MKQECFLPSSSLLPAQQGIDSSPDCSSQEQRAPSPHSFNRRALFLGGAEPQCFSFFPQLSVAEAKSQADEISRWVLPYSELPSLKECSLYLVGLPENTGAPINLPLAFKIVVPCQERQTERPSGCCPLTPNPCQVPPVRCHLEAHHFLHL